MGIGTSRRRNTFKGRKGKDVRGGLDAASWRRLEKREEREKENE